MRPPLEQHEHVGAPIPDEAKDAGLRAFVPTGSRAFGVDGLHSDADYLCFGSKRQADQAAEYLGCKLSDFDPDTDSPGEGPGELFTALRSGCVNLIVAHERKFYERFLRATHVAALLRPPTKELRVALFRSILYEERPEGAVPYKGLRETPDATPSSG